MWVTLNFFWSLCTLHPLCCHTRVFSFYWGFQHSYGLQQGCRTTHIIFHILSKLLLQTMVNSFLSLIYFSQHCKPWIGLSSNHLFTETGRLCPRNTPSPAYLFSLMMDSTTILKITFKTLNKMKKKSLK